MCNFTSQLIYIQRRHLCVLDDYLKLKRAHNISYDATSFTDMFHQQLQYHFVNAK